MGELRENKKRETRQRISDVATQLFFRRGFDDVTLDEIAVAANVSKMTVFNYFARKEELILDREDDLRLLPFCDALEARPKNQSPADALRALLRDLSEKKHPLARIDTQTVSWWRVVNASPALKARLRELADEAAENLAVKLDGADPDALAKLKGALIAMTVRTARDEAFRLVDRGASSKKATAVFFSLMEHGFVALDALDQNEP